MPLISTNICDCISSLFNNDLISSLWYFKRNLDDIIIFIVIKRVEALEHIEKQLRKIDILNIEVVVLDRESELFDIEGAERII